MRYGNCLNCTALAVADPDLLALATVPEMLGGNVHHHHHAVRCTTCGAWWFDDYVTGAFGQPVPARRDTVLCGCPEDDQHKFTRSVVMVPEPEAECHCTATDVDENAVPVNLGGRS